MGIRFACHACGKHLNIKADLAGKRGICPACKCRFRIPTEDTQRSSPIEEPRRMATPTTPTVNPAVASATSEPGHEEPDHQETVQETKQAAVQQQPADTAIAAAGQMSALDLLTSDPSATWYVRPPTGGQYGPANGEILRQWIGEGRVAPAALIWRDGWPSWREASEAMPELNTSSPNVSSPNASSPNASSPNASSTTAGAQVATASSQAASPQAAASGPIENLAPSHQAAFADQSAPGAVATQPAQGLSSSATSMARSSVKINSDNFGYEDSDFANGQSYAQADGKPADFVGRNNVGAQRSEKASRRTLSIVSLGIVAVVLVAALAFVMLRG